MSEETPLAKATEYLFSLKYTWEQHALFDIVDLVDQTLSADGNIEGLCEQLEPYRAGAIQVQKHHPALSAKIFDAIIIILSSEEDAVGVLLTQMDRYHYLAFKMLGWLGTKAEAALPTLIANANSPSSDFPLIMHTITRIAGSDSPIIAALNRQLIEYEYFIDRLVERRESGEAALVRQGLWNQNYIQPPDPAEDTTGDATRQHQYNNLLRELPLEQRELIAEIAQQAKDSGIYAVLELLTNPDYRISHNGAELAVFPFGYLLHEDFLTRLEGFPWPEAGATWNLME